MIRKIIVGIACLALVFDLSAQGAGNYQGRLEASWSPGSYVAAKPKQVGETVGSEFINEEWYYGNITLYTGEINGYPLKYSLLHSRMEILTDEGIKVLNQSQIKEFSWKSPETLKEQTYVNGKEFSSDGVPITGLLEVLYDNEMGLYKRSFLKVKKGTYIPSHDAGQAEDEYLIDEVYLVKIQGTLSEVSGKKDFLSLFGEQGDKIKDYSKANKLSFKDTDDLIELIKFSESIM